MIYSTTSNSRVQDALDYLTGPAYLALSEHDLQFVHNCRINISCGQSLTATQAHELMESLAFYQGQMQRKWLVGTGR